MKSVTLDTYMWHKLLKELEFSMSIVNRDISTSVELYEKIATQLGGRPVKVVLPEKKPKATKEPPNTTCTKTGLSPVGKLRDFIKGLFGKKSSQ